MEQSRYRCESCVSNCGWRGRINYAFIREKGCASHSSIIPYERMIETIRLHAPSEGTHKGWVPLAEVENTIISAAHLEGRRR